jgi:type VI secretion system protein ImpJ
MKGTALAPQHLQIQDRFLESSLQFQIEAANFRPWGFQTLQIDREALAAGTFAISSASGIFPDGMLFDIPSADPAPPPKPLADAFDIDRDDVDLYLVIPERLDRGMNVAMTNGNLNTRYRAEIKVVRDETTGLSERPIQLARKNFRFLTASELRDGYSTIRVANVKRSAAGLYQADPMFVPPLIEFHASEVLMSILRRLVEIVSAKSSQLSEQRRHKNQVLADFTTSDIPNFWLLYTINSHLPLLNHLLEANTSHPERLFNAMLAMAGALTTFSKEVHPRDLPKYDHESLSFCFTDLDDKLRLLLETVVPSNFITLPLKPVQPSIYATALADDRYLKNTRMFLAVNAAMNQADLIAKGPQLIKVCSANHVEHLVRQALPGVPLTYLPTPPASIPIKLNYKYFSLNQGGLAWEAVQRARNLAAYVPGDFPSPQLELVILFSSQ